jgi:hypothetical protein
VTYTDEEYDVLLQVPNWTRSETDHLIDICYRYDLRWPVIVDRYECEPGRPLDDIMSRYYFIVSKLKASRTGVPVSVIKAENYISVDLDYERVRRSNQEILFRKYYFCTLCNP